MKLNVAPYDITYREDGDSVNVVLFGKQKNGQKVCLIHKNIEPFFLARLDSPSVIDRIKQVKVPVKESEIGVKRVEEVEKQIGADTVTLAKIVCHVPRDVPKIRDAIKDAVVETYEFDISFTRRYLLDHGIIPLHFCEVVGEKVESEFSVPTYEIESITCSDEVLDDMKVLALDIETYAKEFNPEKHPILMIALSNTTANTTYKKILTWKPIKGKHVEALESEEAMLTRLNEILKEEDPDMITGYFSDGFDFPYIIRRAKTLGVPLTFGVDEKGPSFGRGNETEVRILGMPHVDIYKLVKKTVGMQLETYTYKLDDVANEVLGEKKHDVDLSELGPAWDSDDLKTLKVFADYNVQDTDLTHRLFEKLFPNLEEMVRIVGLMPYDVNRMAFSQLVEWFIIKQTKEFNQVILNKPSTNEIKGRKRERLKGAFVFKPTPGLYKDMVVFDFMSLYPTIITSHNLSLSSLRKGKKTYVNPDDKNIWFGDTPGFVAVILERIITTRMQLKQEFKKDKTNAMLQARIATLKLLANSFYGYLGFYGARWYCFECAETTTAFGRHYIQKVIKESEEKGFTVVYSDTDSIFISLGDKTKEDALSFVDAVNEEMPGLMELEYEGYYPAGIFVSAKDDSGGAKKRYCLADEEGKLKITGFEAVRRNVSTIAKRVQEHVFDLILNKEDTKGAVKYVRSVVDDLKKGKIKAEELVIHTRLSKPVDDYDSVGPHVAVAKRMIERGEIVGPGSMIDYVIGKGGKVIRDKAKALDEIEEGEYDAEYYIDHQVIPAVEKIFEVIGHSKEELVGGAKQTGLGSFM